MKYNAKIKFLVNQWKKLNSSEIKGLVKSIDWYELCKHEILSLEFVDKFHLYINWFALAQGGNLRSDVLIKYPKYINMRFVIEYYKLADDLIEDNLGIFLPYTEYILTFQNLNPLLREKMSMLYELGK
jgi:hypothetical protein